MYTCEFGLETLYAPDLPVADRVAERTSSALQLAASEWVARLDRSDRDGETLERFERWLAMSPRHATVYARLAAVWSRLDRLRWSRLR